MNIVKYLCIGLVLLIGGAMAYIRLTPVNQTVFHADPETVERPSIRGFILVRDGEAKPPPVFEETKEMLADRVEQIILATPRTSLLAGDLKDGFASYVTRSGLWSFPDVATVKIDTTESGASKLIILSRQVYGLEDFGVNRARVEGWLEALSR